VDDDTVNRRLARSLLEKNGFQVVEADDGMAAVELLKLESGFSLMVLDLEMPAMGGEDVLKHVRSLVSTAGLPVVVLTGVEDHVNAVLRRAGT
jgi:CheY-like chemotaxis protein